MAYYPNDDECGYDESRFKNAVDENFRCAICLSVVKDARMCQHNEHIFCRECIEEHLRVNAQRCPQCQDNLTVATLRPARVINNVISKLKINCDYASRGCPEFVDVEDLERHVKECGFAPLLCSNEGCGLEINKRDKIKHETELCEHRKIPSHDFRQIEEMFQRSFIAHDDQMKMQMDEIKRNVCCQHAELRKELMESKKELMESKKELIESRKEIKNVQQSLSTLTKEMKGMKVVMFQILNLNEQHVQSLPSSAEIVMNSEKCDILIGGGYSSSSLNSAEIFSWRDQKWFEIASMENAHSNASSFIYNDNVFVVGGQCCRSIETLNLKQLPLTWKTFHGELPYECSGHQTVVCKKQILHIGGSIAGKGISDLISEIQITRTTSHVLKKLCHMPKPRSWHEAVVVDDKVLIFGGERKEGDLLNSVLEFDPRTRTFKKMLSLPYPLTDMATVQWRDQVVLLGGFDGRERLNSVIMYDIKTGEITVLPSMLEKRQWCCAVITGDTIVVMGGMNDKDEELKSVECFKMGSSSSWKYLPSMNVERSADIAKVLPLGVKYV